jgi:hypothetical protein
VTPFVTIVPKVEFPPATLFTLHVTAVEGLPVPATDAVKIWAAPVETVAEGGRRLTTMLCCRVTVIEALSLGLAWLTAVTVALAADGRIAGAVNRPAEEIVPADALPLATPFTCHVTFVFVLPVTVA